MLIHPLLAFDGGAVGVIVFLVISFVSWIMNTIQASKQQQEARERQEARRRRRQQGAAQGGGEPQGRGGGQPRVQSEIEAFLEEVTGQKQQPAKRPQPPRPKPQRPNPQRAKATPPRLPKSTAKQPPKPKPAQLGSGVQQHVSTYMSDRIGEQVEQDIAGYVDQHINQHVSEHIGAETMTDDTVKSAKGNQAAASIRDMLKDGDGVRRAILVNEILKRRTFDR